MMGAPQPILGGSGSVQASALQQNLQQLPEQIHPLSSHSNESKPMVPSIQNFENIHKQGSNSDLVASNEKIGVPSGIVTDSQRKIVSI
mmetsp:Transcript_39657/g.60740  ORF Transcript_39657/g.60740 Transcript_39657/m.60740 type:complete len:88 (+) Transcript_39657:2886-3149(+)